MTFWELVEHQRRDHLDEDAELLGRALRELHDELAAFAGELPGLVDLRDDIERLLRQLRSSADLSAEKIESLEARLQALDETVFESSLPAQPLHGDASLYNLLRSRSGRLVWNDFEDTFRGPVHWDVAGYLISLEAFGADGAFVARAFEAYGGIEEPELAPFTAAHNVYDEIWQLYDAQRRA
jgi:thiamine kinase-like enzyme